MENTKKVLYSWSFNDAQERGKVWYAVAFSVVFGIALWGFLTKMYIMSFFVMIISGFYIYLHNNSSDIVNVALTEKGIQIENMFYPYGQIKSYGIIYDKSEPVFLALNFLKATRPQILLRADEERVEAIKTIMGNFVNENPDSEISLIDKITHALKL